MSVDCIRVPAAELLTAGNVVQMSAHQPRMPNLARQGKRFLQLVCPAEPLLNCCRQDGDCSSGVGRPRGGVDAGSGRTQLTKDPPRMNVLARHPTRLVDDKPRTSRHLDALWNDDVHRLPFLESSQSTRLHCGQTYQRAFGSGMQHGSPPLLLREFCQARH